VRISSATFSALERISSGFMLHLVNGGEIV